MMVDDLIGMPYRPGARLPGPATDCFGLVVEVCRRMGRPIPDPFVSSEHPLDAKQWIAERLTGWTPVAHPVAGGLVELVGMDAPGHVGYLLTEREFLHSTKKTGAIISRLDREPWNARIVGYYVYAG